MKTLRKHGSLLRTVFGAGRHARLGLAVLLGAAAIASTNCRLGRATGLTFNGGFEAQVDSMASESANDCYQANSNVYTYSPAPNNFGDFEFDVLISLNSDGTIDINEYARADSDPESNTDNARISETHSFVPEYLHAVSACWSGSGPHNSIAMDAYVNGTGAEDWDCASGMNSNSFSGYITGQTFSGFNGALTMEIYVAITVSPDDDDPISGGAWEFHVRETGE